MDRYPYDSLHAVRPEASADYVIAVAEGSDNEDDAVLCQGAHEKV